MLSNQHGNPNIYIHNFIACACAISLEVLSWKSQGKTGRDMGTQQQVLPYTTELSISMTLQEMAKILNHPQVYSFLHVPVQSGSDSVLMDTKREYCQADFRHVVDFLKER